MAFVKSDLQEDLYTVFHNMTSGDNQEFADGISNAVVTFVASGDVTTSDEGKVSSGTFKGSGSGKLTVTATKCAKIIKDACDAMYTNRESSGYGNDYLAEKIGEGLQQMADDGVVNTDVTGTTENEQGATVPPSSGKAQGTITCDSSSLISALKTLFSDMYNDREGEDYDGNLEFAKKLASEVNDFYTSGQIKTDGLGALKGSKGEGTIA